MHKAKPDRTAKSERCTFTGGDFNTSLSVTDTTGGQKVSKDVKDLNQATERLDLIDICRTLHPTMAECSSQLSEWTSTQALRLMCGYQHEDVPVRGCDLTSGRSQGTWILLQLKAVLCLT